MRELGATFDEISAALRIDKLIVEEHFTRCVQTFDLSNFSAESDEQLEGLLQHAVESYHACSISGNAVGATSALSVRLRCLESLNKRKEARIERASLFEGAIPDDPKTWPVEIKTFVTQFLDFLVERKGVIPA
jgi:hypothetical protein